MSAEVEDAFPLTLLQEGMIFHRNFAAKSAVYHAIASVKLSAPLDLEVMRTVLRQLVERHPMLRTSFDLETFSRPLQLVHTEFTDPLGSADLRGMSAPAQEIAVEDWIAAEKARGFDLDEHPLIRFMIHRLTDEEWRFTYGFHHEIVDGWSEALMITEIFSHYFGIVYGQPVEIAPPSSSMREAVALELDAVGRQENYDFWSRYLDGSSSMRLPRPEGASKIDTGARSIKRLTVPVDAELSAALRGLAARERLPLKHVLMAAHLHVMCTYGGTPDTLTYTVTQGRPEGSDGTTAIGLFVNSLALRVHAPGGNWLELIRASMDSELESLPFRRLPMAELKRHQGNEPLSETLFFFTDYHVFNVLDQWRSRGVVAEETELYGESTFPFCAIFRTNRDTRELEVRLEYDALQFSTELVEGMVDAFSQALNAVAFAPEGRYDAVRAVPPAEFEATVHDWNGPEFAAPSTSVLDLVDAHIQHRPDAVAIKAGGQQLSYGALGRAVHSAVGQLREHGIGLGSVVGVIGARQPSTVAAVLATLRLGATFVPLDPATPLDRLRQIVAGSQLALIVGEADQATAHELAVPMCSVLQPSDAHPPVARAAVPPELPAYIIYTSGSTGTPKGVMVSNAALCASTAARRVTYARSPERFLHLSPLAFDSAMAGLFWTLAEGGTLVFADEATQLDPWLTAEAVQADGISHLLAIPSLYSQLLAASDARELSSLQVAVVAGETCPPSLVAEHLDKLANTELYNEYGPTEATVWSTVWKAGELAEGWQSPIGSPIPGTAAYVLNSHLQPVPIGVAAELCLGGLGLANGYVGRPDLTAERFVPDPIGAPGGRLYRTGDLVRFAQDGLLRHLGRTDNQVKIRGFRIEPAEIEAVLDEHPAVGRSTVLARLDAHGEDMLIAYVLPAYEDKIPAQDELSAHVRAQLPRYMVPARIVLLEALPLTATGKIDRVALQSLAPGEQAADREIVAPATATEHLVCDLFSRSLAGQQFSVLDDFFEVGGDSLRAMHVVAELSKLFSVRCPVRAVFDEPTARGLAGYLDELVLNAAADPAPPRPRADVIETGVL